MAAGVEVGRIYVKVTPDTDGFRRKLVKDLAGADKPVEVSTRADKTSLGKTREAIKRGVAGIETDVEVNPEVDNGRLAAVRQRIKAALGRQKVEVEVDVDKDKSRGITRLLDGLTNIKAPSFGSGINPAGYAIILGGILAVAAPLIGLITSALLTIPGLISLVATPIAALALGMDGLKEAAGRLQEPFNALKGVMSEAVKGQFAPVFDQLAKVFPTLEKSLPTVTQGLADMAKAVVTSITEGDGLKRIEGTITNIGKAFTQAAPGIQGFVDGFTSLALSFSQKLPDIAEWFNGAGKSFSDWVNKITADGTLSKAFDGLGQSLQIVLNLLGDLGAKGIEFFKNPEGIENFKRGLSEIADLIRNITDLSGKLNDIANLFDNFLPDLSWDGFWKDISEPFTSKDAPWRKMIEDPPPLDTSKAIREQRKALADIMGVEFNPSMLPGTPAGQQFVDNLTNGITGQGPQVTSAVKGIFAGVPDQAVQPATEAGNQFIDALTGAVTGPGGTQVIEKQAQQQADAIINSFKGAGNLGANADIGTQLTANIKSATAQATAELNTSLGTLSAEFQARLAEVGTGSAASIQAALAPLQQAPALVMNAFSGVGAAIQGSMAVVVSTLSGAAGQIVTALSAGFAQIPGAAASAFGTLQQTASAGMQGLVQAVTTGCEQAVTTIQALPGQMAAIGSQLFSAMQAVGAQAGAGLAAGITASTGQAVAAAAAMARAVEAAGKVTLGVRSPSRVFADIGENVGKGFVMGLDNQSGNMVGTIREILNQVKEVFGSASGLTLNINMGGVASSLSSAAVSAKDFGTNMTDAVNPTKALTAEGKMQLDDLKEQLALLEIQRKELKVQKDNAVSKEDKEAIQAQIDQIQAQKDVLALEKDKLAYAEKYGDAQWNAADAMKQVGQQTLDAGFGFAKANADQLMSDLGIGGGAITGGANALWDWGTQAASQFIFNVSNVDDAISVKNNQINKQAMGINTPGGR